MCQLSNKSNLVRTILIFINLFAMEITSFKMFHIADRNLSVDYFVKILNLGNIVGACVLLISITRRQLLTLSMLVYCVAIFFEPSQSAWILGIAIGTTQICKAIWLNSICVWLVQVWTTNYAAALQLLYCSTSIGKIVASSYFSGSTLDDGMPSMLQAIVSTIICIIYVKFQPKISLETPDEPLVESNEDPNSQPKTLNRILKIAIFGFCFFSYFSAQYIYWIISLQFTKNTDSMQTIVSLFHASGTLVTAFLSLFFVPDSILIFHFLLTSESLIEFGLFQTNFYPIWALAYEASWPAALACVHHHCKLDNKVVVIFAIIKEFAQLYEFGNILLTFCCMVLGGSLFAIVQILIRTKRQPTSVESAM